MRLLLTTALILACAASVQAREIAGLGSCAEADPVGLSIGLGDVSGNADEKAKDGGLVTSQALGPLRHRFTPTPVSASSGGPSIAPPSPGSALQVGSCNSGASVCGGSVRPNPNPLPVSVARTPRPRPRRSAAPILTDPTPNTSCGGPGFSCR